jgi:LPS-assembly lipoprotein
MSSHDRGLLLARLGRTLALGLVAAVALSACTVQPLYAPSLSGTSAASALGQIAIDPVDTRISQEVRNRLIFSLSGGSEPAAPTYRMKLFVTSAESALGVTPVEAAPAYSITVSATYEVKTAATGDIVLRGTTRGTASFDRISQVYANTRAKLDAENRAAALAADEIRLRLASAAAKGTL